jgi:hypothetical protein
MFLNFSKFAVPVFLTLVLTGCANTSTVKSEAGFFDNKTVAIAPTGQVRIEGLSNTVGSAFGALGVLVEHALTEKSRADTNTQINQLLGQDFLFKIAQDEVNKNIQKFGQIKGQSLEQRTLVNEDFNKWFNPDQRSEISSLMAKNPDLIIDFGFQGLNITNYMAGSFAEGTFGLRVIDAKTGKVVARARTFGVGVFGGVKIMADRNTSEYFPKAQIAFDSLIKKLTLEAIDKITKQN